MGRSVQESEFETLYAKYGSLVHSRCRSILKSSDEAWDATQEVFMKLLKWLPTIDKKESIYSWLLSTSTNHCISMLRKKQGIEFNESYHSKDMGEAPQEKQLRRKEIMQMLLGNWDQKTREIVIYTYIDGYKQEEIAKITGMGESTIRKYLTRFRRKCADVLHEQEDVLYG